MCVNASGVPVSKDIYTGNEANALKETGKFEVLTNSKYLTTDKNLKRGDILLKEGSHTAIVLTDGENVVKKGTTKKSITTIAKEVIAGKWGNGEDRKNSLIKAGYKYDDIQKEVNKLLKH